MITVKITKHISKSIRKTVRVCSIEGKKVLTKDGKEIGILKNIHIDPKSLTIEGLYVSGGIFGEDSYIGKEYIQSLTQDGVILSIVPVEEYIGMMVYDSRGQKIGKVKDIHKYKKTNTLLSIVVEKGFLGGKDTITFTKKQIKEIGRNIVLNISVKK